MDRKIIIITIYYIIGTIGGLYLKNIIPFLLIFLTIHLCIFKKKKFILLFIFLFASIKSYVTQDYIRNIDNIEQYHIVGDIVRVTEKGNKNIYELKADKINGKNCTISTSLYVYAKNKCDIDVGDKVIVDGTKIQLSYTKNEGCFNYKTYLKSRGIYNLVEAESIIKSKNEVRNYFLKFIEFIRKRIRASFYGYLSNENSEICIALVIGEKDNIDENTTATFSEAGLSHIIAISGMHTVYVAYIALVFKNVIGKRKSYMLVIIILFIFCNLAYNSDSVFRASTMLSLFYLAKVLYRKSDSISNLFFAALICLIKRAFSIFNPGFILSIAGTFGIITMYEQTNDGGKSKIRTYIKNQIKLGMAANIILIPIIAKMYNKISLLFLLSSPIINYIMSILMPIVFIFSILSLFSNIFPTIIMKLVALIVSFITNVLLWIARFFQKISILNIQIATPSVVTIFVYYLILYLVFIYRKNKIVKIKKAIRNIVCIYICICLCTEIFYRFDRNLKIYFIDVGQGDCTLIQTPQKHIILIDGGGGEDGKENEKVGDNIVIPFLLNKAIQRIDYMIISHFDSDHVGGLLTVLERMKVKNVIISKQGISCDNFERFKLIVEQRKINIIVVEQGNKIRIESNLYFDILWPGKNLINDNVLNNNSIVCKLCYKNFSMLFTGDIEAIAERDIINYYGEKSRALNATCLKAGHHGSKTSSTNEFLQMIKPTCVVIGVGINNKFGHPNEKVVQSYKDNGASVYRTDKDGEITIIVKENSKFLIKKYINE